MAILNSEIRAARTALSFFTRLPVPYVSDCTADDLRRSSTYFPLVGWLVGGAAAGVWWTASHCFSGSVASGLSLLSTILLTGAMHEDGLADICDGFGGGTTKEKTLEIMQDSRIGAFGVVGLIVVLGLKWQTVASLPASLVPAALVAGHALSRCTSISLMASLDYAREGPSKARALVSRLAGARLVAVAIFGFAPLLLLPRKLWLAAVGLVVIRFVSATWFKKRLGGYTGDCLGATQQVGEVMFLLTLEALS